MNWKEWEESARHPRTPIRTSGCTALATLWHRANKFRSYVYAVKSGGCGWCPTLAFIATAWYLEGGGGCTAHIRASAMRIGR